MKMKHVPLLSHKRLPLFYSASTLTYDNDYDDVKHATLQHRTIPGINDITYNA